MDLCERWNRQNGVKNHWFPRLSFLSRCLFSRFLSLHLSTKRNRSRSIDATSEKKCSKRRAPLSPRESELHANGLHPGWTVTFELRSIIRITALLNPPGPDDMKDYTYIRRVAHRRCGAPLRPRISIKMSNFIFKFADTPRPDTHCRAHRSCFLSLLNSSSFVRDSVRHLRPSSRSLRLLSSLFFSSPRAWVSHTPRQVYSPSFFLPENY